MKTSKKTDSNPAKNELMQAMVVAAREEYDGEYAAAVEEAKKNRDKKQKDDEFSVLLFSQG